MLNIKQKDLLKEIMENKYGVGPFSGMLFNAKLAHPDADVEFLVRQALDVRLKMLEMVE